MSSKDCMKVNNGRIHLFKTGVVIVSMFLVGEALCQKKMNQNSFYKEQVFIVKNAFWCQAIKDGVPIKKITKAKIGQPFYLWVTLEGKQESLDLLKEYSMPIIAKWFRYSSYGLSLESGEKHNNELALLKTHEKWFSKKRLELKKNSFFTFSCWTSNPSLKRSGTYYVRLVYYDNTPIRCGEFPCEYKITVTK